VQICIYPRYATNLNFNLSYLNPQCDPLTFPLLFPYGEQGWYYKLEHEPEKATKVRNKIYNFMRTGLPLESHFRFYIMQKNFFNSI
jgi:hypothetical protein